MATISNDRVKAVVHWYSIQYGLKQYEVAKLLGYNNKVHFSQLLNGIKKIPSTMPNKLSSLDPRINLDFLLGDSDTMILSGDPPGDVPSKPSTSIPEPKPTPTKGIIIPPELATMFSDMAATIRMQQETIQALTNQNK